MSNRHSMLPRNVFKQKPDYTDLAVKYPEFRRICKLELTGKVCIDYKNELALRALTQTLLLEYFELNVDFAPGSLVPTLPLRLNYILWLEDITSNCTKSQIRGIDIGCGSSCIYSLLAVKKNSWQMLALESNELNLEYALKNIGNNKLTSLITLYQQKDKTQILQEYFNSLEFSCQTLTYDFCLCNPPFFDSQNEFNDKTRKSGKRPPPHNCPTGYKEELSCQGGPHVSVLYKYLVPNTLYCASTSFETADDKRRDCQYFFQSVFVKFISLCKLIKVLGEKCPTDIKCFHAMFSSKNPTIKIWQSNILNFVASANW